MSVTEPNGKLRKNNHHRKNLAVVFFVAAAAAILLTYGYEAFADNGDELPITGKDIRLLIFNLMGGIALLIYGINRMGEGLQKAAGDRIRSILGRLTSKPAYGVMVGAGITALIQSSSATTVMVVGFVNARLMTLVQGVGVIIGANIGTTITGQLIAFKLTDFALPIVAVGVGIHFFTKRRFIKHIGLFILGFGVLFLGLNIMKDGVHFLREHPGVSEIFQQFGEKPLLGVLAGMLMTALIQSSSATIGIVISMVGMGALTLEQAVPIVLGDNIGTCITAGLASIGTNRNAKRAALAHVIFNVVGTVIVLLVLKQYMWVIAQTAVSPERQTANAHTIFNVLNTLVFLPFIPMYAKFIARLVSGQTVDKREAVYLDNRLLSTPAVALDQSVKELARMAGFNAVSLRSIEKATRLKRLHALDDIDADEEALDELHRQTTAYLVAISEHSIATEVSEKIPAVIQSVDDIERIGDHCVSLRNLLEEKHSSRVDFSDEARLELISIQDLVVTIVEEVQRALAYRNKDIAEGVFAISEELDTLTREMRENHINRLCNSSCHVHAGVFFLEMVKLYENIGYRCQNIAEAVVHYLG